jgi:catechol 2,3-dioxygenase-like lactoylglutathione lyase family enzyme
MLGRFLEVGLETQDIRASVEFYERLGFSHATTGDTWTHPYGVLTDGRLVLGLHQRRAPSPAITFVKAGIPALARELEARAVALTYAKTGDDVFNELGLRDPSGQMVVVLEARTFSPVARPREKPSLCGDFAQLSIPVEDFAACRDFWENMGFVASDETGTPYEHVPLTSDHLDLAFHRRRTFDRPMLVFRDAAISQRLARLRELGTVFSDALPRGLTPAQNALLEAPEGTALLLLNEGA